MIKAFNSIKEIFLVFYQVLFVEAKERYEITEFYLEECGHNKKMETVLKVKDSQTQQNIINGLKKGFDLPEEIINEDSYVFSDNWKLL